ncbi:MAG: lamin tail domain-containing protein, partial [Planctomycetota bacterium]
PHPDQWVYYQAPTPGEPNLSDATVGFVADTEFSVDRGFYCEPFEVAITTATPGAEIRYTLDGRRPTATSGLLYDGPLWVDGTTVLRAAAFKDGWQPSNVDSQTYLFLDDVLEQNGDGSPPSGPRYLDATFDADPEGFTYADDAFNGTNNPEHAEGVYAPTGGRGGSGGLRVNLGPGHTGGATSGAWSYTFSAPETATYGVQLWYRMVMGSGYEGGEFAEALLEVDGNRHGPDQNHSLIHRAGDGNGGGNDNTGWRRANVTMELAAGAHTLSIGAYNNQATASDEWVRLFLDDLSVAISPWPAGKVNGQVLDYGVDPDIAQDPTWGPQLEGALADIPSVSLVTDLDHLFDPATGIYVNARNEGREWERPTSVELIYPDGTEGFQVEAGLRIRGGYSRSDNNPKHAFRLFFRSEYGAAKLRYPLFGDEGVDEFDKVDLRTSQNYSWSFGGDARNAMVRDVFSRDTQREMGQPYTRSRYYHLYLNGVYWGLYQTQERSEAAFGESYFDGDRDEFDTVKAEAGPYVVQATDGNLDAWEQLWDLAKAGFESDAAYLRAQGLNPDGTRNPDYPVLLDVDNLIDYMLVIFYGGNRDAPISKFLGNQRINNWFGVRNRNGEDGFVFFAHDSEHTLLVDDLHEDRTGPFPAGDEFQYSNPQWIHQELMANDNYRLRFADHVHNHFFNGGVLTPEAAAERFLSRASEIEQAIIAESARWGDAKRPDDPRTKDHWAAVIQDTVDHYFPYRTQIVLDQLSAAELRDGTPAPLYPLLAAPSLSRWGGTAVPGLQLAVEARAGTIYYTTDGTDPRLVGGAVAPSAQVYDGAIPVDASMNVQARAFAGGEWSPLAEATFLDDEPLPIRVTEVLYHPRDPDPGQPFIDEDFEFVELQNTGQEAVALGGLRLSGGVDFTFPELSLGAGEYVLVVRNQAAFASRYETAGLTIAGEYARLLDNGGEGLRLRDAFGETIQSFDYRDGWHPSTDGEGFSLVIVDPQGDVGLWDERAGWRPSRYPDGSPGAAAVSGLGPDAVVVHEVLSHTDAPLGDWIELRNTTPAAIDVGGWYLSDDPAVLKKFRIPDGTVLDGGGFRVYSATEHFDNASHEGCILPFALSELGDAVYLSQATGGVLEGYRDVVRFGAAAREIPFGRHATSAGDVDFVALSAPTMGTANAAPLIGPVVINELMYHPPVGGDEFIELLNVTGQEVPLYDPAHQANTWRLDGAVEFAFPAGVSLAGGSRLLVVPSDPEAFRAKYGLPPDLAIHGPFQGRLDNAGESIKLYRPDEPEPDGTVPWVRMDRVKYNDKSPWPEGADGDGPSLSRLEATDYGNDPANWRDSPDGGTPGAPNLHVDSTPPTTPAGLTATVVSPSAIDLAWGAASDPETGVAFYRIFRNQAEIATSTTPGHTDSGLPPDVPYTYRVEAVNADGFDGKKSAPASATIMTLDHAEDLDLCHIALTFSQPLDRASAENPDHFVLDGGTVLAADLQPDLRTVILTTDELTPGTRYTLTPGTLLPVPDSQLVPGSQVSFLAGQHAGLRGHYYNNEGFTDLGLLRTDATVDFNWGTGSPDPDIEADTFSVRWTGQAVPRYTEAYTFYTVSDDGVRLWVDDVLLVDNWTNHSATENSGTIYLEADRAYSVRLEHYEHGGSAVARLLWSSPSQPKEPIPQSRLLSDSLPLLFIEGATIPEGDSGSADGAVTVRLSTEAPVPVTVAYATADGTATTADGDYDAVTGSLTFTPGGPLTQTVTVPIHGDERFERDEAFRLILSDAKNGAVGEESVLVTIDNDDIGPPGPLRCDLAVRADGQLNPTGPGPRSLHVLTFDDLDNPAGALFAFRLGPDPDAGWLSLDDSGGTAHLRADRAEPEWHSFGEWEDSRLRGLDPGSAYTVYGAAASADLTVQSSTVVVATVETSQRGDVDRSGLATAIDYACVRAALLRDSLPGGEIAWICDVNDDAAVDADDPAEVRDATLTPAGGASQAGARAPGGAATAAQALFARRQRAAARPRYAPLDHDRDGDVDRDDLDASFGDHASFDD